MRSRAKFTSRAVQKAFSEQGSKFLLRPNPQASARFLARLTGKRKDGFGRSGYSSQDRPIRDAKGMLRSLPTLFYGAVLPVLKAARSRRRAVLDFAAFVNDAHQRRSDLGRYEITASKSAQKPSLRLVQQIY